MENLYTFNKIRTFSGKYIDPINPEKDLICIQDIAHSLSMQPRFGGHLPIFYSVAEHSWWCASRILNEEQELAALLHDASEAYLIDIPKPIKGRLTNYEEIENNLMTIIAEKFGFQFPLCQSVKDIDKIALEHEWKHIMLNGTNPLAPTGLFNSRDPKSAEEAFLELFYYINGKQR